MKLILISLTLILASSLGSSDQVQDPGCPPGDPDDDLNAVQLIEARGFRAETHNVTTQDGYILSIQRIINPATTQTGPKKVMMLQHGLLSSSIDFIINSPFVERRANHVGNNLGFLLSLRGYDVWLTNSRGNTYARNHTTLNPNDRAFWEFSFDQMIEFDLPTTINYILKATNQTNLGYVGHSQGTLIMFGLLASQPKYNEIVKPFIALAPVAEVGHLKSAIRYIAKSRFLMWYFYMKGGQFLPSNFLIKFLAQLICAHEERFICSNVMFLLTGFDKDQLNSTRLPVYFSHTPAGTSAWNLVHFGQGVNSDKFAKFDFGPKANMKKYGTLSPPVYDLTKITSRNIALLHGQNDDLADPTDVKKLTDSIPGPLLADYNVPDPSWAHCDFIWGKDAGKYVYTEVLKILKQVA